MGIKDKLDQIDMEKIQNYLGIVKGEELENWNPEKVFRLWYENKSKYLFQLFGEDLIKKVPIKVNQEYNKEVISGKMRPFLTGTRRSQFLRTVREKFHTDRAAEVLSIVFILDDEDFHSSTKSSDTNKWIAEVFNSMDFFLNNKSLSGFLFSKVVISRGEDKIIIDKGTKHTKVLRKLSKWYGLGQDYEEFLLDYSRIMNTSLQDEVTLVYSIHPLDYLTLSDNDNGWSSCVSLLERGGYAAGCAELMNSPSTIVCYIESNGRSLFNGLWNSKAWRELIVITPEVMFALTGYPNHQDTLNRQSVEYLRKLIDENLDFAYNKELFKRYNDGFAQVGSKTRLSARVYLDNGFMYSDFDSTDANTFYAYVNIPLFEAHGSNFKVPFSGDMSCLECGKVGRDGSFTECHVLCTDCGGYFIGTCACCGMPLTDDGNGDDDQAYTGLDGELYCSDCLWDVEGECEQCGENFFREDMTHLYRISRYREWEPSFGSLYYISANSCCYECFDFYTNETSQYRLLVGASMAGEEIYIHEDDWNDLEGYDYEAECFYPINTTKDFMELDEKLFNGFTRDEIIYNMEEVNDEQSTYDVRIKNRKNKSRGGVYGTGRLPTRS